MMKQLAVLCVFLVMGALAAPVFDNPGVQDRLYIDTFVAGADIQGITRDTVGSQGNVWPGDFPTGGASVEGILGGERDMFLEVTAVPTAFGSIFTSIGTDGQNHYWDTNTPQGATGQAYLQWDGVGGDPATLGTNLNEDFSRGGSNTHFHIRVSRDISVEYNIRIVSPGGGSCSVGFRAQGTDGSTLTYQDIWIPFSDFTNGGSCSLSSVGGVQLGVQIREGVDPRVFLFSVAGNEPSPTPTTTPTPSSIPSPSQTGTPTPVPSQSRTPTPTGTGTRTPSPVPSQSRTPTPTPTQTRTPTPTPSPECICICPAFTCALIFDPDDDVNNVYYFTGPGFTFPDQPDDDDDDRQPTNSFTITLGDSGASVLTVSIALIAVIVALF